MVSLNDFCKKPCWVQIFWHFQQKTLDRLNSIPKEISTWDAYDFLQRFGVPVGQLLWGKCHRDLGRSPFIRDGPHWKIPEKFRFRDFSGNIWPVLSMLFWTGCIFCWLLGGHSCGENAGCTLKLTAKTPENGWLEDDPASFWDDFLAGAKMLVSGSVDVQKDFRLLLRQVGVFWFT